MSLKITVAAPFKQMHRAEMDRNQFVFFLALDRKWMNVDQANAVLRLAASSGLVEIENGKVFPAFDVASVSIPLGFRPGPEIFEAPDPCHDLVRRIADATGREENAVIAEMNGVIDGEFDGHLRAGAAAVLLARRYNVTWSDLLPAIREGVLEER
ncbi:DUF2240 family protein [Methanofollis fontis]|uniref:DUF2240 domain-containing protein n=1 Tax=Methanofollis fontis TaxID=2052832 RepID=A0A483CWP9_9EURY|nr:DUF2240 family protein [Methanofollis fontis]TAJ43335.1 DUF2240 domain-containing protein [Methanofollis fontis]